MTDKGQGTQIEGFPQMGMPKGLLPWIKRIQRIITTAADERQAASVFQLVTQPRYHDDERFHAATSSTAFMIGGTDRWTHCSRHLTLADFVHSSEMQALRVAVARAARSVRPYGSRFTLEVGPDAAHLGAGDIERIHTLAFSVGASDHRVKAGAPIADRLRQAAQDLPARSTMDLEGIPDWQAEFCLPDTERNAIDHYKRFTWGEATPVVQVSRLDDGSVAMHMTTSEKHRPSRFMGRILAVAPPAGGMVRSGELGV